MAVRFYSGNTRTGRARALHLRSLSLFVGQIKHNVTAVGRAPKRRIPPAQDASARSLPSREFYFFFYSVKEVVFHFILIDSRRFNAYRMGRVVGTFKFSKKDAYLSE
ncbi:hypothetical protein EVAR_8531_1 [Eumeta japonica]|uniref:Uncharacterized protein n=1 Tax=Eumeta variegata TaxID=151549 RepID=A0A4C1TYN7_EUMVA|nr:hypothetical protein EVAR_8531_1 [Eumeta japonica]